MNGPYNLPEARTILVTGATGQVGGELLRSLTPLGWVTAPSRTRMDLARFGSISETIRALKPRWIINPAAYTAVDKAESEPELAYRINHDALTVLGAEAKRIGAVVVHFSTDYVFRGDGERPWVETDPTAPLNVYGASKLAGEQALAASGAAHLIFRTSWVYGATGKNFLRTILKLARERETLRVVSDQHGAPTWSRDLAEMTASAILHCEAQATLGNRSLVEAVAELNGVYHASAAGGTTWHGFASEAVRLMHEREPATRFATIEPIATADYPTPARRPANSRLNCDRIASTFGCRMPGWQDSLRAVLGEL
ncbi:dTDP-4-dehydrorhamnose reductase [Edaphobacter bradus]|uniref:dTDP-4-dehydrorhamnose reductase n=1 Tax=Edaphobacter bradus TaxID=2259016 RepID=UPI0021DF8553|nr:dTDP-4-dehydrorhamnose reductase [Edaphobacter bradus]